MPPDNATIRFWQIGGSHEHVVGEVERWRALTSPASFTLDSLDRPPESQWVCSGEILSQTADLKEVEIRWTEASDSEMLGFFASDSLSAMTVYLNLKVRHTRQPKPTTPAFPALVDPMGLPETIPDRVFVSTVGDDQDFLNEAAEFHKEWKIPVTRVGSFQEILEGVAKMRSATTLRIVSHTLSASSPTTTRLWDCSNCPCSVVPNSLGSTESRLQPPGLRSRASPRSRPSCYRTDYSVSWLRTRSRWSRLSSGTSCRPTGR